MTVALVTGANSGLGLALCLRLAKSGMTVAGGVRSEAKGQALTEEAERNGVTVHPVVCDVSDRQSVDQCTATVMERFGQVDFLVCNAGSGYAKPLEDATYDEMEDVFNVNYWGVVHCIKSVLPYMRKQKHGRIIAISSIGGLVGQPFNEVYCAAKFAVEGLVESMATYMKPAFNIDFCLVEPGGIRSRFFESAIKNSTRNTGLIPDSDYKEIVSAYVTKSQGRSAEADKVFQTPDEVAKIVEEVILADEPPLRTRSSKWADEFCKLKTMPDPDGLAGVKNVRAMML